MKLKLPSLKRKAATFGLDIGSSLVKAIQLEHDGQGATLVALGTAALPHEAVAEGSVKDPATVADAIREAVAAAGIEAHAVAIGVAGRELIIKTVRIPEVPAKELKDAVHLEAEHHIPFAIEEVFLDYHVVGRHEGAMDLIIVAAKKSKVLDYVGVVEDAGFEPVVVDVDGFALGNQFELNQAQPGEEAVALIDIGASIMKTNVVRGGASIFARDVTFGGNNYTDAIAHHLGVPFEQAEAAKVGRDTEVDWNRLVPALEMVSRELALEAQRTFDYLASSADAAHIGKIVLAGGCAKLPGLAEYLASTWGAPVEIARPFERVTVGAEHAATVEALGPALAVAVGLGLRHVGDKDE